MKSNIRQSTIGFFLFKKRKKKKKELEPRQASESSHGVARLPTMCLPSHAAHYCIFSLEEAASPLDRCPWLRAFR